MNVFKLLVTLGTFLLVALGVFGLRQHQREIAADCARIDHQIKNRQETLLNQRVEIARQTNPWALALGLKQAGINTGDALITRDNRTGRSRTSNVSTPAGPERDLLAPLRETDGSGHSNPTRPRQ